MAAPIALKRQAGDARQPADQRVGVPVNPAVSAAAVAQLQNTVNTLLAHGQGTDVVWTGGVVTNGAGLTVNVSAGEVRTALATFTAFAAATNLALAAADATNPRLDIVEVNTSTGVVAKKDGVAAAVPVAPAVDAGNIVLATVAVPANAVAPGTKTDVRPRPGNASPINGTPVAATNAFTAS